MADDGKIAESHHRRQKADRCRDRSEDDHWCENSMPVRRRRDALGLLRLEREGPGRVAPYQFVGRGSVLVGEF
jgi:hypothetical protein